MCVCECLRGGRSGEEVCVCVCVCPRKEGVRGVRVCVSPGREERKRCVCVCVSKEGGGKRCARGDKGVRGL